MSLRCLSVQESNMSQAAELKAKIFNVKCYKVTGTEDIPSELLKCVAELHLSKQQLTV